MKQIIKEVLDSISDNQINLGSLAARENISQLITDELKSKGCYTEYDDSDSHYAPDTTGMTGHDHGMVWTSDMGGSYLKKINEVIDKTSNDMELGNKIRNLKHQIYNEMTSDGLPEGGDRQAVLESQKLAEQIIKAQEGSWIYESPDGGKNVFRRKWGEYDAKNKEEIDWKTKEPTGRKFSDYNGGHWRSEDNE